MPHNSYALCLGRGQVRIVVGTDSRRVITRLGWCMAGFVTCRWLEVCAIRRILFGPEVWHHCKTCFCLGVLHRRYTVHCTPPALLGCKGCKISCIPPPRRPWEERTTQFQAERGKISKCPQSQHSPGTASARIAERVRNWQNRFFSQPGPRGDRKSKADLMSIALLKSHVLSRRSTSRRQPTPQLRSLAFGSVCRCVSVLKMSSVLCKDSEVS